MSNASGHKDYDALLRDSFVSLRKVQSKLADVERARKEPIAVVGIGCRFPGGANSPEAFWRLLQDGVDTVGEIPADRWNVDAFYHPDPATPGKTSTRWGSCLERIYDFDPSFFGISSREAVWMDPQQRLLLEVTWEALENAGQSRERVAGSQTGVFVGVCTNDYNQISLAELDRIHAYASTGGAHSIAANRISYVFDLKGPSVALDTACSSSLVSIHLACQSLRSGESSLALAGGVNMIISPEITISFSKYGMMSSDGRCKAFDASANGFVRGDGCGMLVLKRLSDAQADGDTILGLIRGSAVNQDGRSAGLTAPNGLAQQAVARRALENAGVSPAQVGYIEAHGTGTALGDPIEVEALAEVYGQPRPDGQPCVIGSVKSNIGHTEGAAGVAGVIKALLAMRHGEIPAQLHLNQLNPNINLRDTRLTIATERVGWAGESGPRLAGVNSFSFGGTNAHVVLEEAPATPTPAVEQADTDYALPISAHTPEALRELAGAYVAALADDSPGSSALRDLCYSAARRTHHEFRYAVVGRSKTELAELLQVASQRDAAASGRPSLVFVCSGHGSQWLGMGRALAEASPVFRASLGATAEAMAPYLTLPLLSVLEDNALTQVELIQPAIFAIQVALATLLGSAGVTPAALIGHSMGEITAAHLAGVLSLPAAARLICQRGQLLAKAAGHGAMVMVELTPAEAEAALGAEAGDVVVALNNSPRSCVLAGAPEAVARVVARLEAAGVFVRRVHSDVAFHSPQMQPLAAELVAGQAGLEPAAGTLPLYSTVDGALRPGAQWDASYWGRNLREPVCFADAMAAAIADGHTHFVELSPHPVLRVAIEQCLAGAGVEGQALGTLQRDTATSALFASIASLYEAGVAVDWAALQGRGRLVSLPRFPWQRERLWLEDEPSAGGRANKRALVLGASEHPLLGQRWSSSAQPGAVVWEQSISAAGLPYLADHVVRESVVVPATAYLELATAAARATFGASARAVTGVVFQQVLILRGDEAHTVQVVFRDVDSAGASFTIASRPADAPPTDTWTEHATGQLAFAGAEAAAAHPALADIQAGCATETTSDDVYRIMREIGFAYGPCFRGVERARFGEHEAIGRIRLADQVSAELGRYHVHPALLDIALHVLAVAVSQGEVIDQQTYLPVGLERLEIYDRTDRTVWSHARVRQDDDQPADTYKGDVFLLDEDGRVLAAARGLLVRRISAEARGAQHAVREWLYGLGWDEQALKQEPREQKAAGAWLICDDGLGTGAQLAGLLEARGERCVSVAYAESYSAGLDGFERLLKERFGGAPPRGILFLWGLERGSIAPDAAALDAAQERGSIAALGLVQAIARAGWREEPRLWLITRGALAVGEGSAPVDVRQGALWGLGRVIAHEHPGLRCGRVDLSPAAHADEARQLFDELWADGAEDQVALRLGARFVARLERHAPGIGEEKPSRVARLVPAGDRPFQVVDTDGGPVLRAAPRRAPGPQEVEIRLHAAGITASAQGARPGFAGTCSGTVAALGSGVSSLAVGQEVIAVDVGAVGSFATVPVATVLPKPAGLCLTQAAAITLDAVSVYAALRHAGALGRNGAPAEGPGQLAGLVRDVAQAVADGALPPPAVREIALADALAGCETAGDERLVALLQDASALIEDDAAARFQADATYLVTGGTGGLGLTVAGWMVEQGARHLALLSRRGVPHTAEGQHAFDEAVASMEAAGAQVAVLKADVAHAAQLVQALAEIARSMPPLRGVIHAAGVLDDGVLLQQTPGRFRAVMAPKVAGAWNLHTLTRDLPLDQFVLFSSVAALVGSPGQGNYSAANTFLDTLAHHRRGLGLPALSINWGPWAEVGMAAQLDRNKPAGGISPLTPEQGLAALGQLLDDDAAQVGVMPLNLRQWRQFYPKAARSPLFALLAEEGRDADGARAGGDIRAALLALETDRRRGALETHLREQICQVLRVAPSRVTAHTPLSTLGFDSLMALEFRNRLEDSTGLTLSATLIWNHQNVAELAPVLAERMEIALEETAEAPAEPAPELFSAQERDELAAALEELGDFSMDELQRAL